MGQSDPGGQAQGAISAIAPRALLMAWVGLRVDRLGAYSGTIQLSPSATTSTTTTDGPGLLLRTS
jgi:hypothetical protein